VPMSDYGCMLRAYRRNVVDAVLACRERSTFIPVLANSFASKTTEIPVRHAERASGTSKYSLWKLINLQFDLLTSMTAFPLRLLSIGGGLMALLGILGGLTIAVLRLVYGAAWAAEGVLTGVAMLFIFTGVQLFGLGLIGEYLSRVYDDVRERPRYVIHELVDARQPLANPRQPSVVPIGPKTGRTA
jgi:undecaprenyl-phosphate 4-deoxy-4-formamido-L-arabinose transferase